jgi:CBS domain-containing protein
MKVRDIMTRDMVSCQKETDVATAARLMLEGRFGTLPVVDAHGRLAGIITDRDIAMAAATRQRNASHIAVHEAMSQRVRSCFADDDLPAALK